MAYSTISKPGLHFNTLTWTGDGGTQSFTGVGFQPDFVWSKARVALTGITGSHFLYDAVRGGGAEKELRSNDTGAEGSSANQVYGYVSSFDSDGFTTTAGSSNNKYFNESSKTYVGWNWKAGGSASSNSDGSITSSVSANTTAGFSISTFTTPASGTFTVGHGLGVAPKFIIARCYNISSDWICGHDSVGWTYQLSLNSTAAKADQPAFNDTAPTSTVWTGNTANFGAGYTGLAYCFAEKKGYSKFGSYTGNGNADGTFIYTGFKPAFLMTKRTDTTSEWVIFDNKRDSFNQVQKFLQPNSTSAEGNDNGTSSGKQIDFLSNGWKMRGTTGGMNASGGTYIYMAFAEEPLVANVGNSIPATAR